MNIEDIMFSGIISYIKKMNTFDFIYIRYKIIEIEMVLFGVGGGSYCLMNRVFVL